MKLSRRKFIRNMSLGLTALKLNANTLVKNSGGSEALLVNNRNHPKPAPKGYDRLPLSWYQSRVQQFKQKLKADKIDAILLEKDVNKVYFSG